MGAGFDLCVMFNDSAGINDRRLGNSGTGIYYGAGQHDAPLGDDCIRSSKGAAMDERNRNQSVRRVAPEQFEPPSQSFGINSAKAHHETHQRSGQLVVVAEHRHIEPVRLVLGGAGDHLVPIVDGGLCHGAGMSASPDEDQHHAPAPMMLSCQTITASMTRCWCGSLSEDELGRDTTVPESAAEIPRSRRGASCQGA